LAASLLVEIGKHYGLSEKIVKWYRQTHHVVGAIIFGLGCVTAVGGLLFYPLVVFTSTFIFKRYFAF
jgi:hypothetical protein